MGRSASNLSPLTFSLSSLMLFMVFISVGLGLTIAAPGLGIPFWVLGIFSWIRTARWVQTRQAAGTPLTIDHKVADFLSGIALTMAVFIAGIAATLVTCLTFCGIYTAAAIATRNEGEWEIIVLLGIIVAPIVGIVTMVRLGIWTLGRGSIQGKKRARETFEVVRCPKCGTTLLEGIECWMCGSERSGAAVESGIAGKNAG